MRDDPGDPSGADPSNPRGANSRSGGGESGREPSRRGRRGREALPVEGGESATQELGRSEADPASTTDVFPQGLTFRRFVRTDFPQLAEFECSDGTRWQSLIEAWVQRKSRGWLNASRARELWVLAHDVDGVIGVLAFEPGDEQDEWFVAVIAVKHGWNDRGVGGGLLESALDIFEYRSPIGAAYWKVDDANEPSHRMSRSVGATLDPKPAGVGLSTYSVRWP